MAALTRTLGDVDVRDLLGGLRVPTLVLHRRGDRMIDPRHSAYLAERIPGAKLVWLEGEDSLPTLGDTEAFLGEIEEFLTGGRRGGTERALLTVLFTDICGGTERVAELGDKRWRDLLAAHDAVVRREIERFGGREVKTIGDGFLIAFDGAPSRAVRCADSILRATDGDRHGAALRTAHGRMRAGRATTWAAWRCTSPRASAARRRRARCSPQARPTGRSSAAA